jgi:hypothetical protein
MRYTFLSQTLARPRQVEGVGERRGEAGERRLSRTARRLAVVHDVDLDGRDVAQARERVLVEVLLDGAPLGEGDFVRGRRA